MENVLFPHDSVRASQSELVNDIYNAIQQKKHIICHAPTGLGKTAAALAPALTFALNNNLTVFFLTSRHTQHLIAIETLRKIKEKHSDRANKLFVVDIIGKRWMCPVENIEQLHSFEFTEYCKSQKEAGKCEFYNNTKKSNKPTTEAKLLMEEVAQMKPMHSERIVELASSQKMCPYEITTMLAVKATVVVADYNYIFNSHIRELFLAKSEKSLDKCIVIVDEAHNLPNRVRELLTANLSTITLKGSLKECEKFGYPETRSKIVAIQKIIEDISKDLKDEKLVDKKEFLERVEQIGNYEEIIADFEFIAEEVRMKQKRSFTGQIAAFLEAWKGEDQGFARILSRTFGKRGDATVLSYRCLDPSLITRDIIKGTHSTIMMSGTLTPTSMYRDVLGFPDNTTIEKEYSSPFPPENKLCLIIPETTTKFTERNEQQFKRIAEICSDITNTVPGNIALFFPSYYLRDEVNKHFRYLARKTTLTEEQNLTKEQKIELLDRFKEYSKIGSVLLAVYSGSFGEGIDLPGDLLNTVVVIGLPLQKPDLETKELIKYYDELFGKGWDYGYLFPAMNKCFQSAGRCIRTETDRGAIVFLDQRFTWPNYFRCFPKDWELQIAIDFKPKLDVFFKDKLNFQYGK